MQGPRPAWQQDRDHQVCYGTGCGVNASMTAMANFAPHMRVLLDVNFVLSSRSRVAKTALIIALLARLVLRGALRDGLLGSLARLHRALNGGLATRRHITCHGRTCWTLGTGQTSIA
jgi:hypothetical protein